MNKNIGKNISKNLISKHSYKFVAHVKQSAKDILKTSSKRAIQKISEATGELIGNKIAHIIIKVSKPSSQNNLEAIRNKTKNT